MSEASSQLTELAGDVVAGAKKVLTKGGEPFVAVIDARKLGYYRALEAEHRQRVVLSDIAKGLEDVLSGRVRSGVELQESFGRSNPED
nr:hypothetical protein [Caballeronia sp. NCTM1]